MPDDPLTFDHGQFCRVDLNARDPDAARAFYSGLFGWTGEFAGRAAEAGPYERFVLDGRVVAGMGRMSAEMRHAGTPSVWVNYVCVDEVDAIVQRARQLGGSIRMPATDIFKAGRMAFVDDPTGAAIAFWQPVLDHGAEAFARSAGTPTTARSTPPPASWWCARTPRAPCFMPSSWPATR